MPAAVIVLREMCLLSIHRGHVKRVVAHRNFSICDPHSLLTEVHFVGLAGVVAVVGVLLGGELLGRGWLRVGVRTSSKN